MYKKEALRERGEFGVGTHIQNGSPFEILYKSMARVPRSRLTSGLVEPVHQEELEHLA